MHYTLPPVADDV